MKTMSFEVEYALKNFRDEEPELFDKNGRAYECLNHIAPMERMLKLINLLVSEYAPLA